jgi:hypothetical protein
MNTYSFKHYCVDHLLFIHAESMQDAFDELENEVKHSEIWVYTGESNIPICPECSQYIANCEEGHSSTLTKEPEEI